MRVALGNRHAIHTDEKTPMPKGKRATVIDIPDDYTIGQSFTAITHPQGVWANHATEGATPAWVASESDGLSALLAEHFGGIEIRDLEETP